MDRTPGWQHYTLIFLLINGGLLGGIYLISIITNQDLLGTDSFRHFDANHYLFIQEKGYHSKNVAFFPLVPYLWRMLGLGIHGILILNTAVYGAASVFLARHFKFSLWDFAIGCTLPVAFFLLVPYSEALFFAACVLLLIGLDRNSMSSIILGLFVCTLTRPSFTVFLPALAIVEWVRGPLSKEKLFRFSAYIATVFAGAVLVGWIQWLDTGEWFKFFSVQKEWGNELQIPTLPLRTWGTSETLRLDAAALAIGIAAMGVVSYWLIRRLKKVHWQASPAVVFSICFLAGMAFIVLIFRGGSLFSLNRFIFATPFAFLALKALAEAESPRMNWRNWLIGFLGIEVLLLFFQSYTHLMSMIRFTLVALYLGALLALAAKNLQTRTALYVLIIVVQFSYLVFVTHCWLTGKWIG